MCCSKQRCAGCCRLLLSHELSTIITQQAIYSQNNNKKRVHSLSAADMRPDLKSRHIQRCGPALTIAVFIIYWSEDTKHRMLPVKMSCLPDRDGVLTPQTAPALPVVKA